MQSTGGFLRRRSITIMIGLHHDRLQEALELMKKYGEHMENHPNLIMGGAGYHPYAATTVSVPVACGVVVSFVMDIEQAERY